MTAAVADFALPFRIAFQRASARFYKTRETAFGTASYETILRSVGPLGPQTHRQAQTSIILAGLAMGIVRQDADGNLSSNF